MKFTNALAIPALVATLALSSCSNGAKNDDNLESRAVQFESYTYDLIARDDSDSLRVDSLRNYHFMGDLVLPQKIGRNDISALRDSLMSVTCVEFPSKGRPNPVLPDGVVLTDLDPKSVAAPSIVVNSLSVDLLTSELIVWENYSYDYEVFMAHGVKTTTYINYSIRDNKILTLADIMKKGYETPLLGIIREVLKEQLGDNLLVDIDEVELPDNFRIKANGVEFIYGSTSIAPSSEGEITVKLTVMDLAGVLNSKAMKLILGPQES